MFGKNVVFLLIIGSSSTSTLNTNYNNNNNRNTVYANTICYLRL